MAASFSCRLRVCLSPPPPLIARYHHHPSVPFSCCAAMARSQWSPPLEPHRPPLPYMKGARFPLQRIIPPPPFIASYRTLIPDDLAAFFRAERAYASEHLKSRTLVDHCLSVAPLPSQPLDETIDIEIIDEISVGDSRGAQVVLCTAPSLADAPVVAKIYDPLYLSLMDDDYPGIPRDPIAITDSDFTVEAAAYSELNSRLGGVVIPKYFGSWRLQLPLLNRTRVVHAVLMEKINGTPLNRLDPEKYTMDQRLNVVSKVMEADTAIHFAGAIHDDLAPRNIILECDKQDLGDPQLQIRVIDLNTAKVHRLCGAQAPCTRHSLPESPISRYWKGRLVEMGDWIGDDYYFDNQAYRRWLMRTWGKSDAYQPLPKELLEAWSSQENM